MTGWLPGHDARGAAHALALAPGAAAPPITRFAEVAPAALLTDDIDAARTGSCASWGRWPPMTDHTARLRETLQAFLSTGAPDRRRARRRGARPGASGERVG